VRVPVPEEVDRYLGRFPGIASLGAGKSADAAEQSLWAGKDFPEVYRDAETNSEYELYARQDPYDARILDVLEEIARPFDSALQRLQVAAVTTDFRSPR